MADIHGLPIYIHGFPIYIDGLPIYIHGLPIYIHGLPIYIHGLPISIPGLPISIPGLPVYTSYLTYICLFFKVQNPKNRLPQKEPAGRPPGPAGRARPGPAGAQILVQKS